MKTKYFIIFSLQLLFSTVAAQHIIKPNGDAAAKPNFHKINQLNPSIFNTVKNLKLTGKNTKEIAMILKTQKVTATDVFKNLKSDISDGENVGALCFAGFTIWEITETLKADGKTPMETTELLKNSAGCNFEKNLVLRAVKEKYGLSLALMIPIIKSKYTNLNPEIVDILITLSPYPVDILDALGYSGIATSCREIIFLTKNKLYHFDSSHLGEVLQVLIRSHVGGSYGRFENYADGLMAFDPPPIQILETFKSVYFTSNNLDTATELAKIGKFLKISRNDVAAFLRNKSYSAPLVLDSLQAVYGS